jgi:hypothetical protein
MEAQIVENVPVVTKTVTLTMSFEDAELLVKALNDPTNVDDVNVYKRLWSDGGIGKGVGCRIYHALLNAGVLYRYGA